MHSKKQKKRETDGGGGGAGEASLGVGTPGPAPQVTERTFQEAEDLRGRKEGRVQGEGSTFPRQFPPILLCRQCLRRITRLSFPQSHP